MNELLTFLRANPVLIGILAGGAIATLVLGFIAFRMARSGQSLKPIGFMVVFLGIVAGPQVAFHLARSMEWIPKRDLTWMPAADRAGAWGYVEREDALAVQGGRFVDQEAVFGEGIDPALVTDLRSGQAGLFGGAELAQMAVLASGGTSIVARYPEAAAAADAAEAFLVAAAGTVPARGEDGTYTFARPAGDLAKVLVAGRTLVVLTGPDAASLDARLGASRIVSVAASDPSVPLDPAAADFWLYRPAVLAALLAGLLLLAVVWFFRGTAWATTVDAAVGALPVPAPELERRLMAVNDLDVPFSVERQNGRVVAAWRFSDARWLDLARAHGTRRTHRILMELDPVTHTVRPVEQWSLFDASAGRGGASVRWASARGVMFFQYEHQRVFGLQVDERGRFVPKLSHAYTFDLQEMKTPIIEAVTRAGWRWRPTMWRGPSWLHWLTS